MSRRPPRGAFQMALANPDRYESVDCYVVGPFAIHDSAIPDWPWKVSHAATGMAVPYAYGRSLTEAASVAEGLSAAIDWNRVKRSESVGRVTGLTKTASAKIMAALRAFDFLEIPKASRRT